MTWGAEEVHEELKGVEFVEKEITIKGFETVDPLSGFVTLNGGGGHLPGDFLRLDFDLKDWLLKGKSKRSKKTDSCVYHDSEVNKHSSCWCNSLSKHLAGNYENRVFAQAVKDWRVGSYKTIFDSLKTLGQMDLLKNVKEGLSGEWRTVYFGFSSI